MPNLLESNMAKRPTRSNAGPDSLSSFHGGASGGNGYPSTGFRVSSSTNFEGQGLDSARHLEESTPVRDAFCQPSTNEILAATAHELRLPLSHIKGFVTSLRRTDVDWDDDTRSEFIAEIDLETDRLAQLVASLLAPRSAAERGIAARTPHGSYNSDPALTFAYPAAVVQGALHRIRGLLEDRLLRLDVSPCLDSVPLGASQMERVLANLIQNAIKYSPPGRPIGVSARLNHANELEFSVEDEGPGIRAEDRERIFCDFQRYLAQSLNAI